MQAAQGQPKLHAVANSLRLIKNGVVHIAGALLPVLERPEVVQVVQAAQAAQAAHASIDPHTDADDAMEAHEGPNRRTSTDAEGSSRASQADTALGQPDQKQRAEGDVQHEQQTVLHAQQEQQIGPNAQQEELADTGNAPELDGRAAGVGEGGEADPPDPFQGVLRPAASEDGGHLPDPSQDWQQQHQAHYRGRCVGLRVAWVCPWTAS
eukprot:1152629-Pelagomonas_calceolata.AAC.2